MSDKPVRAKKTKSTAKRAATEARTTDVKARATAKKVATKARTTDVKVQATAKKAAAKARSTGAKSKRAASGNLRSARSGTMRSKVVRGPPKRRAKRQTEPDINLQRMREAAESITISLKGTDPDALVTPRQAGLDDMPMPAEALEVLSQVLSKLANGENPKLLVLNESGEMTTAQAAEVLGVSRPHLVHLLDAHKVPHRRVGNSPTAHRRIPQQAVLELKALVLAGHALYDDLPEPAQAEIRQEWDNRVAATLAELDFRDELHAAGKPWAEADEDGNLVMRDAVPPS